MIIGIDFDGTCVTHDFPNVGKDIGAVPVLKKLVENGHKLVLFTMRSNSIDHKGASDEVPVVHRGPFLDMAVEWFKKNEIPLYGINRNPTQDDWTTSPKAYCNLYIDDAALGCPLTYHPKLSNRMFVDWKNVEAFLNNMGLFKI